MHARVVNNKLFLAQASNEIIVTKICEVLAST